MAPRTMTRPARENDFSNVGKVGRRTGVTLPQGRLDVNGMEEISGIFSSPRKPSPLKQSISIFDSVEVKSSGLTPSIPLSTRKSIVPPRSASPRKSGISGTARRNKIIDVLGQNKEKEAVAGPQNDTRSNPATPPSLPVSAAKEATSRKTPEQEVIQSIPSTAQTTQANEPIRLPEEESVRDDVETEDEPFRDPTKVVQVPTADAAGAKDDYVPPAVGDDDDQASIAGSEENDVEVLPIPVPFDDEEADQTFEPEIRSKTRSHERTIANSRRKRKSDAIDQDAEVEAMAEAEAVSSPAAKRAKRISDQSVKTKQRAQASKSTSSPQEPPSKKGRPALKGKDSNVKLSARQEDELNNIIEKVKPRPGQKKSLYILKRETPANDGVLHTRSGRISVKPLAYWRNERCVYGGSPGGASLNDGARFPLNSIKEIIRTEQVNEGADRKSKKSSKGKGKAIPRSRSIEVEDDSDQELDEDYVDSDAEPWETDRGIFKGSVAVWDPHQQTILDEEEEIDIAYAPASIITREVKDSTFRYAKLLSSKSFGSGIVDLPPGGVKKTKNSRRMHMAFFVATGRVIVRVGPQNGPENCFSIGKGGWWQVPRGNQYSIENQHLKPARIFFSQASETIPQEDDD